MKVASTNRPAMVVNNRLNLTATSLIQQERANANWNDVLARWERIANWTRYRPNDAEFQRDMKSFLVSLWAEKDWLKQQYRTRAAEIEKAIDDSKYMAVVGDLANTVKHRYLARPRVNAKEAGRWGQVTIGNGATRRLYFVTFGNSKPIEIYKLLNGAINEFEELRFELFERSDGSSLTLDSLSTSKTSQSHQASSRTATTDFGGCPQALPLTGNRYILLP